MLCLEQLLMHGKHLKILAFYSNNTSVIIIHHYNYIIQVSLLLNSKCDLLM